MPGSPHFFPNLPDSRGLDRQRAEPHIDTVAKILIWLVGRVHKRGPRVTREVPDGLRPDVGLPPALQRPGGWEMLRRRF